MRSTLGQFAIGVGCFFSIAFVGFAAEASTTPTLDIEARRFNVALGGLPLPPFTTATLALDYALRDNLSVGGVYAGWGLMGARVVGRTSSPDAPVKLGWSVEAGLRGPLSRADGYGFPLIGFEFISPAEPSGDYILLKRPDFGTVLLPSLVLSYSTGNFTARCAAGPGWILNVVNRQGGLIFDHFFHLIFNPEIAWRLLPGGELTISGQGGLGWRQSF